MPFKDPEKKRAYNAEYRKRNAERARERTRQWRLDNPERAREGDKRKREKNPELYKAINKRAEVAWYARNRDAHLERGRQWRKANLDKVRAYSATHRQEHPERQRQYVRDWQKRNPDIVRATAALRRALERGSPDGERVCRFEIFTRDNGRCHLCGKFVSRKTFTLDHLTPVALGGNHTALNVKVAHRSCNSRKGARFISAAA